MTIFYEVGDGLYVNLTNKCTCACTFCVRNDANGIGSADELWLEHDPNFEEVKKALGDFDLTKYTELVFCGFGEPLEAYEVLCQTAAYVKENYDIKIRINTNGHGNLINGKNIVPSLKGLVDTFSISLNAADKEKYQQLNNCEFGEDGFEAMLDFAKECVNNGFEVIMSTVGTMLTTEEEARCRKICSEIGAGYRIRSYIS